MFNLDDDHYCFVCGKENAYGLKLSFQYVEGKITSSFTPSREYQGYKEITHGGIITTVLDEAMIQAAIAEGFKPVTAEITVRFRNPLRTNETAMIEAEITARTTRLLEAASRVYTRSGQPIAEATAKLFLQK